MNSSETAHDSVCFPLTERDELTMADSVQPETSSAELFCNPSTPFLHIFSCFGMRIVDVLQTG